MPGLGGFNPCPLALGGDDLSGLTAAQWQRFTADLCAVSLAAPLAIVTYTISGTTPVLVAYTDVTGANLSNAPTLQRFAAGYVVLIWPVSLSDGFEVPEPFNVRHARAFSNYDLASRSAVAVIAQPNAVTVQTRTTNTGAAVDSPVTLVVW